MQWSVKRVEAISECGERLVYLGEVTADNEIDARSAAFENWGSPNISIYGLGNIYQIDPIDSD